MRSYSSRAGGSCLTECHLLEQMCRVKNGTATNQSSSDSSAFNISCSSLLDQLVQHCSAGHYDDSEGSSELREAPTQLEVWGFGFLFMALISSTSLAGAMLLPLRRKPIYDVILMFLVSLAMGCLIGNGVFVLVPEAFEIVEHQLYLWKSLAIIMGIYMFYVMEQVMGMVAGRGCCRLRGNRIQGMANRVSSEASITVHADEAPHLYHSHHHHHQPHCLGAGVELEGKEKLSKDDSSTLLVNCTIVNGGDAKLIAQECTVPPNTPPSKPAIATIAYMVLVGHGIHNFIDGMSIGAAFASDKLLGISLSLAVVIEEIPHGLGDFAILLTSGMSKRNAILYNFLSGCPCYVGLVAGVKLSEVMHAAPWILGFAGGIFIYISLVDLLPEMKEAGENSSTPVNIFLIQNTGIICGVAIIAAMATYGKEIQL